VSTLLNPIGIFLILAAIVIIISSFFLGPYISEYKLSEHSIEFVIFGKIRVWKISYHDISDVYPTSLISILLNPHFGLTLMNRPFTRYVEIHKRRGIFRYLLITPDAPQEFVRTVRQKIGKPPNSA
jgi:hypothetical protein